MQHFRITTAVGRQRLLILGVAFFYWISLFVYLPTLPVYVQMNVTDYAQVGLVLSMYGLWQVISLLPIGIVADYFARRKFFILTGIVLNGLAAWLMATTSGAGGLLLGRSLNGVAATTWTLLIVVFSGQFSPAEAVRATAVLTFANSAGRVLATASTGYLNRWGGYSLAFYVAVAASLAAFLLFLPTREKRDRHIVRPTLKGVLGLIFRRDVLAPALLSMVIQYTVYAAQFGFLPLLAAELGADDVMQSALASLNIAVVMLATLFVTFMVKKLGNRRLLYFSFFLVSASLLCAALAPSMIWLFVAQVFAGFGGGIRYPVLAGMSIEHVAESERSTAMGMHMSVISLGMFIGPWLSGVLADAAGMRFMFALTALAVLLLGLFGTSRLKYQEG